MVRPRLVLPEDRLGSKGKYFAFGEERTNISPASPANDTEKFATYTRDGATGLDYANQRYYSSIIGRFTKSDSYEASGDGLRPQSWNRYVYAEGDPVNAYDPTGACTASVTANGVTTSEYFDCPDVSPAGSSGLSATHATLDPLQLNVQQRVQVAQFLQQQVRLGHETDCQALADYIETVADGLQDNPQAAALLKGALAVITPLPLNSAMLGTVINPLAGISGSYGATRLNDSGQPSGFLPQFQDTDNPNDDQAHHFAAFFQLGYSRGAELGAAVAPLWEMIDRSPANIGDINLGTTASRLGSYLGSGVLPPEQVAGAIRDVLCKP